jgi:hypothetical protein
MNVCENFFRGPVGKLVHDVRFFVVRLDSNGAESMISHWHTEANCVQQNSSVGNMLNSVAVWM